MHTHATAEKSNSSSFVNKKKQQPFFSPVIVQPKLTIGPVDDPYEREADTIADNVVQMKEEDVIKTKPTPVGLQRKCMTCEEEGKIQRKCERCEEEEQENEDEVELVQMKPAAGPMIQRKCSCQDEDDGIRLKRSKSQQTSPEPTPAVEKSLNATGQPLDSITRNFMQNRFGYDFSEVRIHNDSLSHKSSSDINALAYTHGNHIVFGSGQYQPGTIAGKRLLAHELVHVVQQGANNSANSSKIIQPKYKREVFGPVPGAEIHAKVFAEFIKNNTTLVTEAPMPGSNKGFVSYDLVGEADMYKSDPDVTIPGVKGTNLGSKKVEINNHYFTDLSQSSATKAGRQIIKTAPKIKKDKIVGEFPDIFLGDLKPAEKSEVNSGNTQLKNYLKGYNDFVKLTGRKSPTTGLLSKGASGRNTIKVSDKLDYSQFVTQKGSAGLIHDKRRIWVYYPSGTPKAGLFFYFDLPTTLNLSKPPDKAKIEELDDHLTKLKKSVRKTKQINKKDAGPQVKQQKISIQRAKKIQRQGGPDTWEPEREKWAGDTQTFLQANEGYIRKAYFDDLLAVPGGTKIPSLSLKILKRLEQWSGPLGKLLFKIRILLEKLFGTVVEKFEKLAERFSKWKNSFNTPRRGLGGWINVFFKAFMVAFKIGLAQMADRVWQMIKTCANAILDKIIRGLVNLDELSEEFLKPFQEIVEEANSIISSISKFIEEEVEARIGKFIDYIQKGIEIIQWIKGLEWLIRGVFQAISCGVPPVAGCLWGLFGQLFVGVALEEIIGVVLDTKKAKGWINDKTNDIVLPVGRWFVERVKDLFNALGFEKYVQQSAGSCAMDPKTIIIDLPTEGVEENDYPVLRKKWELSEDGERATGDIFLRFDLDVCNNPILLKDVAKIIEQLNKMNLTRDEINEMLKKSKDPATGKYILQKFYEQFKILLATDSGTDVSIKELELRFCQTPPPPVPGKPVGKDQGGENAGRDDTRPSPPQLAKPPVQPPGQPPPPEPVPGKPVGKDQGGENAGRDDTRPSPPQLAKPPVQPPPPEPVKPPAPDTEDKSSAQQGKGPSKSDKPGAEGEAEGKGSKGAAKKGKKPKYAINIPGKQKGVPATLVTDFIHINDENDKPIARGYELFANQKVKLRPDDWDVQRLPYSILVTENHQAFLRPVKDGGELKLLNDVDDSYEATVQQVKGRIYEIISGPLYERLKISIGKMQQRDEHKYPLRFFFRSHSVIGMPQ